MKVSAVVEHDDGSADVVIEDLSAEEVQAIMQVGFITLLERLIEEEKQRKKVPAILKGDAA